jgi:hypothetical protein
MNTIYIQMNRYTLKTLSFQFLNYAYFGSNVIFEAE